jgi:hypothetical protein
LILHLESKIACQEREYHEKSTEASRYKGLLEAARSQAA